MNSPKISVIVPVYNVEKYLRRCIDSILAQTFTGFELLLIDDGSKDKSGEICDEYAKKDSRVRVFHKENGGVSSARNLGLDNALGEWVCFVDADDSVSPFYIEHLVQRIVCKDQIVMSNVKNVEYIKENISLVGKTAIEYMVCNGLFALSGPQSKLFNLNVIQQKGIHYPEGVHMGEDGIFFTCYLCEVSKVSLSTEVDYFPTVVPGHLSSKFNRFESEIKAFYLWREANIQLFCRYYSKNAALNLTWEERVESQFLRSVNTLVLYKSFKEQIRCFKSIPQFIFDEYKLYGKNDGIKNKIRKYLLTTRLSVVYLVLINVYVFLKYRNRKIITSVDK